MLLGVRVREPLEASEAFIKRRIEVRLTEGKAERGGACYLRISATGLVK